MLITACVIVKNEAADLPLWLKSMEAVADELVIVDTGSTDGTLEMARKSRAKVFQYKWRENFAAAKNFALSKAQGEWIIFCDADEHFATEKDQKNLLSFLRNGKKDDIQAYMCPIINIDGQKNVLGSAEVVRVFRNSPHLRYFGAVHEQLYCDDRPLKKLAVLTDVRLFHTGYDKGKIEAKLHRNIKLMQSDIKLNGEEPRYYAPLADCYFGLGDYERASLYAQKFLSSGLEAIGDKARVYKVFIASGEASGENAVLMRHFIGEARKRFPQDEFFQIAARRYQKMREKIKNSACVIVKNEAANLLTWFENIRDLVDEIIVVDTGSSDNTKLLAEKMGARVYDYKWQDDFAAAKNFALSKARGEWIFFLDADEYFPKQCHAPLKEQMKRFSDKEGLICRLINIDADNDNAYLNSFLQMRIFRNKPQIKYVSKVHEMLHKEGKEQFKTQMLSHAIYIYHTGYSQGRQRQKATRNLQMLQSEVKKKGQTPLLSGYISDCYEMLGDEEKSYFYAQKAIEDGIDMLGMEIKFYIKVYKGMLKRQAPADQIEAFLSKAEKKYERIEDFHIFKALYLETVGKYAEAEACLEEALAKIDNSEERIEFSSFVDPKYELYFTLGDLKLRKDDQKAAINYFSKAVHQEPQKFAAWQKLYYLLQHRSYQSRFFLLQKLLPAGEKGASELVLDVLAQYPLDNLYAVWQQKNKIPVTDALGQGRLLLAQGRIGELKQSNVNALQDIYKKIIMQAVDEYHKNHEAAGEIMGKYGVILPPAFQQIMCNLLLKLGGGIK